MDGPSRSRRRFLGLVASGASPDEQYREQTRASLTDAISVTVDVDLDLEAKRYRKELVDLIRSVK